MKLTAAQRKRINSLSKTIRASLDEVLEIAREAGCKRPALFVECEGPTFHVMDADNPGHWNSHSADMMERQAAIVFSLPDNLPPGADVGAW